MSRSAAARTHSHDERALRRPRTQWSHGPARARRVSGPVRPSAHPARPGPPPPQMAGAYAPARTRMQTRPPLRLAAGGAAIALRVADSAVNVSASRTMDRLVR
ncbi:MAG: hypothetical protein QOG42_680, partial [Solirubrobacteraceae bacterium]|nr:hypothetical protein [Solirubrobacteraceae bacterium]